MNMKKKSFATNQVFPFQVTVESKSTKRRFEVGGSLFLKSILQESI